MKVKISAHSVETPALRELLAALASVGLPRQATVGLNGPECWTVETPDLRPDQFATVVGQLVKFKGEPVGEVVRRATSWRPA